MMPKHPFTVAVVGLGYVGLPLAAHIASKGIPVIGIDTDDVKLRMLAWGRSYIPDVKSETIQKLIADGAFTLCKPGKEFRTATHMIVTVPTPLSRSNEPDLRALKKASAAIAMHLRKGQTVVYESSTFPGTLEEVVLPVLAGSGLTAGSDYFLGYSPERIDPGNSQFTVEEIPKVISGYTQQCLGHVKELYDELFQRTVPVSSPKVAELCKLFENIQRLVNISLVNEMDLICSELNIDFRETLEAAATKPFGFTLYTPGPGIGGHCIPVDPQYFQWKAKKNGQFSKLIHAAQQINERMPHTVVERIEQACARRMADNGPATVLLIGLAYKKDVNDIRESAAMTIFKSLLRKGYCVEYVDPFVPDVKLFSKKYVSKVLNAALLRQADVTVILTDHSNIDWRLISELAKSIVDTRGVLRQQGLGVRYG